MKYILSAVVGGQKIEMIQSDEILQITNRKECKLKKLIKWGNEFLYTKKVMMY